MKNRLICNYGLIPKKSQAVPENSCAFSFGESFSDSMSLPGWASPNGNG